MLPEWFMQYWALLIGSVLGTAIALLLLWRLYASSPRGKLRTAVQQLQRRKHGATHARRRRDKAMARFAKLQSRAASIKPSKLSLADEAVQDASLLQKTADDLVLVAIKEVRDVILEDFPPNRQDVLRNKYL